MILLSKMRHKNSAKLMFFCGKMAAGKSTLARDLAVRENAVLFVQDDFLNALFPGEITDISGFFKYSSRLKNALTPHVCALLSKGISVVLDFPGNDHGAACMVSRADRGRDMLSMNCTSSRRPTPCAKVSFVSEARGYLLALPGPGTRTLKPSLRIFSLRRRMKTSMSSVMSAFSRLQLRG